ncbi:DDE superfamily endonuclease [Streptomyces sp. PanSC19]|nr:DDE superfamily endonuclease [Streptomyces sp. PanSC19]
MEGRRHKARGEARQRGAGTGTRHRLVFVDRLVVTPIHLRLRTLADVFAYARTEGVELRLDATEVQARRPVAGRGGRRAFASGTRKQNTVKATVIADHQSRTLWTDALRPGRMHDATAACNEGIGICFQHFPDMEVLLDDGCPGLRRDHPGQQALMPPPRSHTSSLCEG